MTVSYWLDRPYRPNAALAGSITADAVVIGAGMTGIGLAYFLRDRGLSVVVLERDTISEGATGRSAGFLVSGLGEHFARSVELWGREPASAISRFHLQNHALLAEIVARHDIECEYARDGSFVIAIDEQEEEVLRRGLPLMRESDLSCEFVEASVINRTLGTTGFGGGLFNPLDGHVNPVSLIQGMAAVLVRGGCRIFEHSAVRCIREAGGWIVETEQGNVTATLLFLASNAWASSFVPELALEAVRGQCLAVGPLDPPPTPVPCYTNYGSEYWRGSGRQMILGGMRRAGGEGETCHDDTIAQAVQLALERFRGDHFPHLERIPVTHRWSGIMCYSPDGLPLVGEVPGRERMFLAAGYTGHGFGWGFLAALWLVNAALDRLDEIPQLCRINRVMCYSPSLKEI